LRIGKKKLSFSLDFSFEITIINSEINNTFYSLFLSKMNEQSVAVLLRNAKQILHEADNNPTIDKKRITWIKVAVDYLLDDVYNLLFEARRLEQVIDDEKSDEDYQNDFNCLIGYSINDITIARLRILDSYFISLNNK
jgi:hypothetical protein